VERSRWRRDDEGRQLDLAINVSAVQLLNPQLLRTVESTLKDLDADPCSIVLEITETILIQDGARALVVLRGLKAMGLRLALDDFGTGYSSLSHLHRFPIDIIKIDRSFVERVTFDHAACAIVEAVTKLARELGMSVIAEGAETPSQAAKLIRLGCASAQGYYFARPMSAVDFATMLDRDPSAAPTLPAHE